MDNENNKDVRQFTSESILKYIRTLNLDKSTKLPSEDHLAIHFGVSRITVRTALKELSSVGIIFSKVGKGTFVNKEALQVKVTFNPIEDLRVVIIKSGYEVKVNTVNVKLRTANDEEVKKLNLSTKEKLLIVERIFFADDHPAVYCIDRIPINLFIEDIGYENPDVSIFTFVKEKLKRNITWDKVEISTSTTTEIDLITKSFHIKDGKALLNCDIINYDDTNTPILYSNEFIDTNYIIFSLIRMKKL